MNILRKILGGERNKNRPEEDGFRPWQLSCSFASLQAADLRAERNEAFRALNVKDAEAAGLQGMMAIVAESLKAGEAGAGPSELVCHCIDENFRAMNMSGDISSQLNAALLRAGKEVFKRWQGSNGAAAIACIIYRDKLWFSGIGDCGLYLYRSGQLSRVNRVHNMRSMALRQLIRQGGADAQTIGFADNGQSLTQFVGMEEPEDIDFFRAPFTLMDGDVLLLCSDGVDGSMPKAELVRCLSAGSAKEICSSIDKTIAEAELPYQDNYTAMVFKFGD